MATIRLTVTDDEGNLAADYPLNNGELAECLDDAATLRNSYYEMTGVRLEPALEPGT